MVLKSSWFRKNRGSGVVVVPEDDSALLQQHVMDALLEG